MPSALGNGLIACPAVPPVVRPGQEPLQTEVPRGLGPFVFPGVTLTPLAGFSMEARVLSRKNYRFDDFAMLSHVDLFVGWGVMAKDEIVKDLPFYQAVRHGGIEGSKVGYNMPISYDVAYQNASNVHLIPANMRVARAISRIGVDDYVRIDGWLVSAVTPQGWRTMSSLSRDDRGTGACEIILVCNVAQLAKPYGNTR